MPEIVSGVGTRMRSVRLERGLTQSKVSEMLGVSDRSYKFYELEKVKVPLWIVTEFCAKFSQNLNWLVYGEAVPDNHRSTEVAGRAAKAVFEQIEASKQSFSGEEIQKFVQFIFMKSITGKTSPEIEAELFFAAIAPSVESVSDG